jgi:hypothetical protein
MIEQAHRKAAILNHRLRCLAALIVFGITLPVTAAQGPLSGDQVRALIVGNTVVGPLRGSLYDFSYAEDGNVVGAAGGNTDAGTWRIRDGNVYCHEWSTFFGGYERCYQWYDTGKGRFRLKNVDTFKVIDLYVWRIRPGMN